MDTELGPRLEMLRKRCGLSIRQLAEQAKVAPGMISCIERGKNSPSISTLQKILMALGTNLGAFFSAKEEKQTGPVFLREYMRAISDGDRTYTIVFGKRPGVSVELLDETMRPAKRRPAYETLKCDVAGYILSGNLTLEVKGQPKQTLRPGDAFYIPKGEEHRGYAESEESVRLVTVYNPARY